MAAFKVALLLFLVVLTDRVVISLSATEICYTFDDGTFSGWTNDGFQSSAVTKPVTTHIPDWEPPAGYAFVQDQSSPSKTGSLTLKNVEIYEYDVLSASLYRHVENYDSSDRINVSWTTAGLTLNLLMNPNYDDWPPIQAVTCSSADTHCCPEYPCTGVLQIFGKVLDQDDLSAVDFVGINSNCSAPSPSTTAPPTAAPTTSATEAPTTSATKAPTTTITEAPTTTITEAPTTTITEAPTTTITEAPTTTITEAPTTTITEAPTTTITEAPTISTTEAPTSSGTENTFTTETGPTTTPKPAPAGYCNCEFNYDVCDWSLESGTDEWHWSAYVRPDLAPPFTDGDEYIWIEDASGDVSSPTIFGADSDTTFGIDYYYDKSDEDVHAYIYFGDNRLTELPESHPDSRIFTFTCGTLCCAGASSCDGQFTVSVENVPGEKTEVAIDRFQVTNSKECPP